MKKILALILALCLVMTLFAACGDEIDNGTVTPNKPVSSGDNQPNAGVPGNQGNTDAPNTPGNTSEAGTWNGYDLQFVKDNGIEYIWERLDNEMKANLAAALDAIKRVDAFIPLAYSMDYDTCYAFMQLVLNCAMDYPYVDNHFGQYDTDGDGKYDALTANYNTDVIMTEEDAWALTDTLNARLNEIVAGMPQGVSQYEQLRYLHDTLVFYSDYSDQTPLFYTAYGALVDGMATCQGYADAMHLLLNRAGFETCFCIGVGNNEKVTHKWNYVKLDDGQWYILDPTWADPVDKDDPAYICYDYFLVSDEELLKDHKEKIGDPFFEVPTAYSMEYSFHAVEGYECSTYDEAVAVIEQQIRDCAAEGRRYLYLRMRDEETYNLVREDLFRANKADGGHGEIMRLIQKVVDETGANFNPKSWGVYATHDESGGPLAFTITLRYTE